MSKKMDEMTCTYPIYLRDRKLVEITAEDLTCETPAHLFKTLEYHMTDLTLILIAVIAGRLLFTRSRQDLDTFHAKATNLFKFQRKQM